ncbi:MAG: 5-formyltetrahydrofolate cyclo-ligase [Elusimicrobia bacterium RIFCSPLOWO2_01_FULL_54_10]|nr:MAG: 5-formyltetrahydrofolate cyclo-ligase [Elusimicrobia bacterium RIFCSPLOWO2_01_FULL_54_10]
MKEDLRKKFKVLRGRLPAAYRKAASGKIADKLFSLPEWKKAGSVGIYVGTRSEVDTAAIFKRALAERKKVRAPKVLSDTKIRFFEVSGNKDLKKGTFGILEPKPACKKVGCSTMDLLIVPGLVFDKKGYRLGYGLGYYDRFLPRAFRSFKVGLSYDKTFVPSLPHDPNDKPVDAVITEKAAVRKIV